MNQPQPRTRTAEVVRGLSALAVLVVLLAGVPAGLLAVGGSPIPHALPTWEQISATLTQPDTGNTVFLAVIKTIGWAAWCLFTTTTFLEAAGYRRGRPARRLPRPIRPMQHLARDLVATVALLAGAVAPIAASTTPLAHQMIAASHQPDRTATRRGELSVPDMTSPHRQAPLLLAAAHSPARPHRWHMHVVRAGDTLWAIARHSYGTGIKYTTIFNASRDVDQPAGTPHLNDPDHIYPGQRIKIPDLGHPSRSARPRPPAHTTPHSAPPVTPPTPRRSQPPPSLAPTPHRTASSTPSGTVSPAPSSTFASPPAQTTSPSAAPGLPATADPSAAPAAPVRSPATGPPHAERSTARAMPAPPAAHDGQHSAPTTVRLSSGAWIGMSLAAAMSVAVAATRLHRRRRRTHTTEWPNPAADPAPPTPEPAAKARKVHMDTYATRGDEVPSDHDLIATDLANPTPTQITVGIRDGDDLTIDLSGLNVGLTGPGATGVARAILTELLAKSRRYRVEVVIIEADAPTLFAETGVDLNELARAIPGLVVVASRPAAITHLEAEFIHRARLMEAAGEPDVPALRTTDPGEPLPAVILIAAVSQPSDALQSILQLGRPYCVGGLLLGPWPTGTTAEVSADGTVSAADGPDAATWTGAQLFHLTAPDTHDMLHVIQTANGAPEAETPTPKHIPPDTGSESTPLPADENDTQTAPRREEDSVGEQAARPVHLHLLGPVRVEAAGKPVTTGVRRITRDLLAYLALHPSGVTREQGIDALMPERDVESGTTMFHTAINGARKVLRTATGLREPMFVIHTDGRYRLDPDLIDVDLWQLQTALDRAQRADNDDQRLTELRLVPALYPAEFAEDLTFEWAETERERLRRHATDALAHLARFTQNDDPDRALAALEQAIDHDTYAEPLYRAVMRLQARLGHTDAVRRTYELLKNRLADLDTDPAEQTHQLLLTLLGSTPKTARKRPPNESPSDEASTKRPGPKGSTAITRPLRPRDPT